MKYLDLDLDLFDHRLNQVSERFRVRVSQSPGGSQRIKDAVEVQLPSGLADQVARLVRRQLDARETIELGKELGNLLFPVEVRSFFRMSLGRLKESERLRIRIRCDDYALAEIPWEFAYVSRPDTPTGQEGFEGFLALDGRISIVRHEVLEESPVELQALAEDETLRVGILVSNPQSPEFPPLEVKGEAERIVTALRAVKNIEPMVYPSGSQDEFEQLAESQVHLFHFAGHGEFPIDGKQESGSVEGRGQLILVGEGGKPLPVSAESIARNLKKRGVRLVVLSACEGGRRDRINAWSGIAPSLIREGIPAVVGMQATILDASGVAFSESFYATLLQGEPIDAAVYNGRQAIANAVGEADRDWGVPVLYLRTSQAVLFPIRRRVARRYVANLALLVGFIVLFAALYRMHLHLKLEDLTGRYVAALAPIFMVILIMLRPIMGLFRGFQEESESRLQAFLGGRRGSFTLAIGLAVLVVANLTTTSLYLSYADSAETEQGYHLRVMRVGGSWSREIHLTPGDAHAAGHVFFPRFRDSYEVTVIDPPIFRPKTVNVGPWQFPPAWPTTQLNVPADLTMKDQRALRLFPEPSLRLKAGGMPAWSDSSYARRFDLVITAQGRSDTLKDVKFQTILIAADSQILQRRRQIEGARFEENLRRHEERLLPGFPEPVVRGWHQLWISDTTWFPDVLREAGTSGDQALNVTITIVKEGSTTPVSQTVVSLSARPEVDIQTVFLKAAGEVQR